ncbi:MAG: alpha-mannosidase [Anaerolineae bacterium]
MSVANPYTLHVVSHTHWDREWYEPFQVYRSRLVALVDSLLEILDQEPGFRSFTLDGQAVVLEDYLEIRPDRRPLLEAHIRAGRLHVGPWYVLPDEFLVSGESLIRNLIEGRSLASAFGGGLPLGYTPDSFGHVAQLPQILRGLAIEAAVLRRGLADEPVELMWEAPDGSRVLLLYLRDGYDNAAWMRYDPNGLLEDLAAARDSLAPHSASSHLLLLHGTDHMAPKQGLSRALSRAESRLEDRIVHSNLPDYVAAVRAELDTGSLPVIRGALRNPKRHHLLPGVLSTRMPIKQRNQRCQTLLERRAEPMVAWARILTSLNEEGAAHDHWRPLLRQAWRELLQNHAHDSICGCSVDAVYEDVERRFSASETIAKTVRSEAASVLVRLIDTTTPALIDASHQALVVFNPLVGVRTDLVRATMPGYGSANGIEVLDDQGRSLLVQEVHGKSHGTGSPTLKEQKMARFLFRAEEVPGQGYRTYWLRPGPGRRSGPSAHRASPALENDLLRVQVDHDTGTLDIFDKDTGLAHRGLNRFVDGGDRGDTYNYCPPEQDRPVDRPTEPPQIEVLETGPVRSTLEIRSTYRLPAALNPDRRARSAEEVEVPITSRVSLARGIPRVEIETLVGNRASDHRLRVHFPTPFSSQSARLDGPFLVSAPPASPAPAESDWVEQPSPTVPLHSFLWLGNDRSGLAVAVRGLPEAEVLSGRQGSEAAITLLRCVGWLSRDDLSTRRGHAGPELAVPGGQCLGDHRFHYALLPSSGNWQKAYRGAQAYLSPLEALPVTPRQGPFPAVASLLEVHPDSVAVSAVKPPGTGEGLIVRLYNLQGKEVSAQVRTGLPLQRATRVSLDEEEVLEELPLQEGRALTLRLGPYQITTIRLS